MLLLTHTDTQSSCLVEIDSSINVMSKLSNWKMKKVDSKLKINSSSLPQIHVEAYDYAAVFYTCCRRLPWEPSMGVFLMDAVYGVIVVYYF